MNFRKNNGVAGIDVAVAVIVLVTLIPTMFGVTYNLLKSNNSAKRKSTAVKIATDVIETAKAVEYEELELNESAFTKKLDQKYTKSTYNNAEYEDEQYEYTYYETQGTNDEHYQIQVGILNNKQASLLKKVKVMVFYSTGNKEKTIDISTIIQK